MRRTKEFFVLWGSFFKSIWRNGWFWWLTVIMVLQSTGSPLWIPVRIIVSALGLSLLGALLMTWALTREAMLERAGHVPRPPGHER